MIPKWISSSFEAAKSRYPRLSILIVIGMIASACGGGDSGSSTGGAGNTPVASYTVGGAVTGLAGSGLILQIDAANDLPLSTDGDFTFAKSIASGSSYAVTVKSQPEEPLQTCHIANGQGTVTSSNIANVVVTCATEISKSNASQVTATGLGLMERLPQLAEFTGLRLAYLADHLASAVRESCSDPALQIPGTTDYAFNDRNSDGKLSAGDSVELIMTNCFAKQLGDYITAKLNVTVLAPPLLVDGELGFAASINLDSFLLMRRLLSGSVNILFTDSEMRRVLSADVTSSGLKHSSADAPSKDVVTVLNAEFAKTLDYVSGLYRVDGTSTFRSSELRGEFRMTITEPLSDFFRVYPRTGTVEFRGDESLLLYSAINGTHNEETSVTLKANASQVPQTLPGTSWSQTTRGFSWWESRWGWPYESANAQVTALNIPSTSMLYAKPFLDPINLILSEDLSVNTPIKLFFPQRVDAARTSFYFERDPPFTFGEPPIPAVMQLNGAIATLTAESQLEHGTAYYLRATNDQALFVGQDFSPGFNRLRLKTKNNLLANGSASPAVATPGQTVALTSQQSDSAGNPIVAAKWTQRSGTAVVLNDANSRSASFVVPAAAANGEALVFDLTIKDAIGEEDTTTVTTYALTDFTRPFAFYRQGQHFSYGKVAERATLLSSASGSATAEFLFDNQFQLVWTSSAPSFDAVRLIHFPEPLVVGDYPLSSSRAEITQLTAGCNEPSGKFSVREIVRGPLNEVVRFAADFDKACAGFPPVVGSVRVNSTVPLP